MFIQFAQKAFIVNNGALLLIRKSKSDPHTPGFWEVPGGRMESGEDVDEHICREVWEEVGVPIKPGRPFHIWHWIMDDNHEATLVQVVAVARLCDPLSTAITSNNRRESDHLDNAAWVSITHISDYNLIPSLKPAMDDFLLMYLEQQKIDHAP